jgi:hypothetical protein
MSRVGPRPVALHLAPIPAAASNRLTLQLRLVADEWDSEHICLAPQRPPAAQGEDERIRWLLHLPARRPGESAPVRKLKAAVRRGLNALVLAWWLWRSRACLLHGHELDSLGGLAFWVLVLRRPGVWDPHDYYHATNDAGARHPQRWMLFLERHLVRRKVPVLAVSNTMLERYRALYPTATLFLTRNLSARAVVEPRHPAGDPGSGTTANGAMGGVTQIVYPGLVLEGRIELELVKVVGSQGDLRLDILGRDGGSGYADRIRMFLESQGIGNVRLLGAYSPDSLIQLLSKYHYALFPYPLITENIDLALPNKFFQCLDAGLPMLIARTSEMGGLVEGHGLGLTYPAGDYQALVSLVAASPGTSASHAEMVRTVVAYRRDQVDHSQERTALLEAYRAASPEKSHGEL